MYGGSTFFARPAHQRRLWPLHSQLERDDEDEEVASSQLAVRELNEAPTTIRLSEGGSGSGNNGRQVSDRQRQQMLYTESLSPSPLEEPHEETDARFSSLASSSSVGSSSNSADGNPLSAAILYVYSLVTTSPADVAGLRPRDFIIAIDSFTKRGWQPDMIEVTRT